MFVHLYENTILKNPKSIFAILLIALICFGYFSKDFRLDASSETLLIEGDPDLKYLQEISKRYGSKDFLILTYTPKESMISENSINNLLSLKYKIQSLDWVYSVITILDIPLLDSSDAPLQERLKNFKFGLNLRSASIYFALTPNNVIFSLLAIFNNKSFFLYIGDPSNKTIEALDANELTNQFHIIQPQVVK